MAASLNRRFTQGLLLNLSWTWSKAMDDATAATFSTVLTPRRPQDSQNIAADYSRSALDRTHRVTLVAVYDLPFFKTSSWLLKNTLGNWEVAPIYTYESPEYFTVLSGVNSNLNGDSTAIDRTIFNVNGVAHTGSGVTAYANPNLAGNCDAGTTATDPNGTILCTADLVAYVANNPNARYITAGPVPCPHRSATPSPLTPSTTSMPPPSSGSTSARAVPWNSRRRLTTCSITRSTYLAPSTTSSNPQTNTLSLSYQTASSSAFGQAGKFFKANARTMQLTLKFNF